MLGYVPNIPCNNRNKSIDDWFHHPVIRSIVVQTENAFEENKNNKDQDCEYEYNIIPTIDIDYFQDLHLRSERNTTYGIDWAVTQPPDTCKHERKLIPLTLVGLMCLVENWGWLYHRKGITRTDLNEAYIKYYWDDKQKLVWHSPNQIPGHLYKPYGYYDSAIDKWIGQTECPVCKSVTRHRHKIRRNNKC